MALGLIQIMKSTDAGAPTINGNAGQMITALDAILINGYNSATMTSITRSGSTATVTKTTHGFVLGQVLTISGANETEYNGTFKITNVGANTFDYTVSGTPATPATGTITAKVSPLGYTSVATGTNLKAYQQPSGTNGFVLYVDDVGTQSTHTEFRGYETLTSITNRTTNNGTNPFPTAAQVALGSGPYMCKTSSINTARAWMVISDGKMFYMFTKVSGQTFWEQTWGFGDFPSLKAGDTYNTMLIATTDTTGYQTGKGSVFGGAVNVVHCWLDRNYAGAAGGLASYKYNPALSNNESGNTTATSTLAYPNEADQAIYVLTPYIFEKTNQQSLRGRLPGIWWIQNNINTGTPGEGDTLTMTIEGVSRNLVFITGVAGSTRGLLYEASNTWQS